MLNINFIRGTSLFLVLVLLFCCSFISVSASNNDSYNYVDVSPVSPVLAQGGDYISFNFPSWFSSSSDIGYYPPYSFYVIGQFDNCAISTTSDSISLTNIISSSSEIQVQHCSMYSLSEGFFVVPLDSSMPSSCKIFHVYFSVPQFDISLDSFLYGSSDYSVINSSISFSSFSVPYTSGSASYHYIKIPSYSLSLAKGITFSFSKYSTYPDLDDSFFVSVYSGTQLVNYSLSQDDSIYTLSISDLDPASDLIVCISFSNPNVISLDSVFIRHGLLLSETDLLYRINDSLNSNFSSIKDLLSTHQELLSGIRAYLISIRSYLIDGFSSVGSWFTSLWNNLSSSFTNIGTWIQNQTDTLGAKLDALINGTQAQQEAAQQAQQNAAALDQQLGDLSSGLQVNQPNSDDVDGSVTSYLPADSGPILANSFGSILGSGSVLPLFMISLILTLVSFLVFGKRG